MNALGRSVALFVTACFLTACLPEPRPPQDASPYPPQSYSQPPPSSNDYETGEEAGRIEARRTPEAGYFCLGVGVGVLLPLAVLAAMDSKGGGCNGGGGGSCGGGPNIIVVGVPTASSNWNSGYQDGYQHERERRQGRAFVGGFVTGLAIFVAGCAIWYADPNNRTRANDTQAPQAAIHF